MEPRIEQFSRWVPRATMEPITGIRKRLRMARRRVLGGTARCLMTGGTVLSSYCARCPSPFLTPQGNSRPPLSRTPQALHRYCKKKTVLPKGLLLLAARGVLGPVVHSERQRLRQRQVVQALEAVRASARLARRGFLQQRLERRLQQLARLRPRRRDRRRAVSTHAPHARPTIIVCTSSRRG